MRRCVNRVAAAAAELSQQERKRRHSGDESEAHESKRQAVVDEAVAAMQEAARLLIAQQLDNDKQHYDLVKTAIARRRPSSALDDYAGELLRPGSSAKRSGLAGGAQDAASSKGGSTVRSSGPKR